MTVQNPHKADSERTQAVQAQGAVDWQQLKAVALKVWMFMVAAIRLTWKVVRRLAKFIWPIFLVLLVFFSHFLLAFVGGGGKRSSGPTYAQRMATRRQMGEQ